MSSQSPGGAKSNSDQISTDDDEDKKFVSQAVTFMIGHARNGFVPLCASVASLLKEQARLKQEIESLQKEVSLSKRQPSKDIEAKKEAEVNELKEDLNYDSASVDDKCMQDVPSTATLIKLSRQLPYKKIEGCTCSICVMHHHESSLAAPLEKGMKVIIRGELCGTVEYVGHVEAIDFPEIQVGIKFSEAIGNTTGRIQNKVYFSVPKNHGMFVPLSHILCVIP